MLTGFMGFTTSDLNIEAAINRQPLVVSSNTPVLQAIAHMVGMPAADTVGAVECPSSNSTTAAEASDSIPPDNSAIADVAIAPSDAHEDEREPDCEYDCMLVVEQQRLVGIVRERDIMRLIAQRRSLEGLTLGQVMQTPKLILHESDLTDIPALIGRIQPHAVRQIPLVDQHHRPVGLIHPDSLRSLFSQHLARLKMATGQHSEASDLELFEEQMQARTASLEAKARKERLVSRIADQIRSSLDLQVILDATVREVQALLGCDRTIIYQLHEDYSGIVVAESISQPGQSVLHSEVHDPCVSPEWIEPYRQGRIRVVNDIYGESWSLCHQEMLIGFDIRAKLMVPIVVADQLWGLMIASYRDAPYYWDTDEIELVQQISVHVAIALQQATTYQQLQDELQERKRAEARLRESEQRYASLTAAAPVGIFRTDADGHCIYLNERCSQITGMTLDAAAGQGWWQQIHPDDQQRVARAWSHTLQTQTPFCLEYRFQYPNGTVRWVYEQTIAEHLPSGRVLGYVGTITDISDRKQVEMTLSQREAQSRALLTAIPDFMFCLGADGVYREIIRSSSDIELLPGSDNPVGQAMVDILPPAIAERHLTSARKALQTGEMQVYEQQVEVGDRLQDEEVRVVKSGDDEVLFIIRNITERKRVEAALQNSVQTNRAIIEALPDLLIQMGRDGRYRNMVGGHAVRVKYPSVSVTRLSAFDPSGVDPSDPNPATSDPDPPEVYSVLSPELASQRLYYANQALETGCLQVYEQIFKIGGDRRHEEVRIAPLNHQDVLVIIRDVTDLKQAEHQLMQLNRELENIVQARTAELEEREARYRALVEVIPDLMIRIRVDGTYLDIVEGSSVKLFKPETTRPSGNLFDVLPYEDAQRRLQYVRQALASREIQFYDYELEVDREVRSEEARVIAINDEEALIIVRDITDRKQAEAQVHALLHRTQLLNRISSEIRDSLDLDIILQSAVNAIVAELRVDFCCFAWYVREAPSIRLQMVKKRQSIPHLDDIVSYKMHYRSQLWDSIEQNQIYRIDRTTLSGQGQASSFSSASDTYSDAMSTYLCLPIHTQGGKIGCLQVGRITGDSIWHDEEIELLTGIGNQVAIAIYQAQLYEESQIKTAQLKRSYQDLQEAQLQLVQSEKMSSLGQLVAGVAHEINNPVSFIYGNVTIATSYAATLSQIIQLYQQHVPNPPEAIAELIANADLPYILDDFPKLLASMETGSERIRDIVKSLRTFSRLDQADYKAIDIHENIENTLVILQNRLNGRAGKPEIQLIKRYGDLPSIECYSSLLNQVFMNLLVNAIDAIEERQIQLCRRDPDSAYRGCITITTAIASDNKVTISIRDNGTGMGAETQAKIFNPFFTTKPIGLGTGMGLSTSYQIVTGNHRGHIKCQSNLGQGTEFTLELWQSIGQQSGQDSE